MTVHGYPPDAIIVFIRKRPTRTAGCGSLRRRSKNAGMASLTASRFNGTCIDLHYRAVRLLSYCVAPFLSYIASRRDRGPARLEVRPPHPVADKLISLFLRQMD